MNSPEALSGKSDTKANKWSNLKNEVPFRGDEFDAAVEKQARELSESISNGLVEIDEMTRKIESIDNNSYYVAEGLDIREEKPDNSKMRAELLSKQKTLREQQDKLTTMNLPGAKEQLAEKMRQEAEKQANDAKALELGLRMQGGILADQLRAFDLKIQELQAQGNNAGLENVLRLRDDFIRNEVIPAGYAILERQEKQPHENMVANTVSEKSETDTSTENNSNTESNKIKLQERIQRFIESIPEESINTSILKESYQINRLLQKREKYFNEGGAGKHSFIDNWGHRKDELALKKYGFDPLNGNSETFEDLLSLNKVGYDEQKRRIEQVGRERLANYKTIDLMLKSDDANELKKRLKRAGYNKIPKSWDDEDFTSDELEKMSSYAYDLSL